MFIPTRRARYRLMTDRQFPTRDDGQTRSPSADHLLKSAFSQIEEDSRIYNRAVGSFNTHLKNHRQRRDLHDIPFRSPTSSHDTFEDALIGDPAAIQALLRDLIDQFHLDSEVRRHPRTYPIHVEAADHLESARKQLITTLEEALRHIREEND